MENNRLFVVLFTTILCFNKCASRKPELYFDKLVDHNIMFEKKVVEVNKEGDILLKVTVSAGYEDTKIIGGIDNKLCILSSAPESASSETVNFELIKYLAGLIKIPESAFTVIKEEEEDRLIKVNHPGIDKHRVAKAVFDAEEED